MKDNRGVIVFNVADREFDVYKDVSDAAGHVDMVTSTLSYNLSNSSVHYTGTYFIGYGNIHKSNRGGRR